MVSGLTTSAPSKRLGDARPPRSRVCRSAPCSRRPPSPRCPGPGAHRAFRGACRASSRTRRTLRLRRPVTPPCIHCFSRAILRSSLWRSASSVSSTSSRQSSKCAKPLSRCRDCAAVDPHGRRRQRFEKAPVVADQHDRRAQGRRASSPATRSPAGPSGWLARRAAAHPGAARSRGQALRAALRRPRGAPGLRGRRGRDRRARARPSE